VTDDRWLERAARSFIEVGPTAAPPHVVEEALIRIKTTPQERDWLVPWRPTRMKPFARLVGIAAAVSLLVGGVIYLGGQPPVPAGGAATTTPATGSPNTGAAASPTVAPVATRTPIPRPSAAVDDATADQVAKAFQDLINTSDLEAAADLVWVGARINGRFTFSRADVLTELGKVCGARSTADWERPGNVVRWDTRLIDRPGFTCPLWGQGFEAEFLVENGLIVGYQPLAERFGEEIPRPSASP